MKKLGKINISPEKVMRNEELLSLRGGYEGDFACCYCKGVGFILDTPQSECDPECQFVYNVSGTWKC